MRKMTLRAVLGVVIGLGSAWNALAQEAGTPPPSDDSTAAPTTDGSAAAPTTDGAAAAAAATSGDGTDDSEAAQPLDQPIDSNASFAESIGIDVPAFHGLEPALALAYDSGARNGFVGVGWRLLGLSVIERASVRFGSPRYDDATDVFLLDGEELVACVAGMTSPSCTTGGTHATRIESYLRIKRDAGAANNWEVTRRGGTKLSYQPIATWGSYNSGDPDAVKRATNYRWLLASVADTHGNIVQYSYWCDGVPDCYIAPSPTTATRSGSTASCALPRTSFSMRPAPASPASTIDSSRSTFRSAASASAPTRSAMGSVLQPRVRGWRASSNSAATPRLMAPAR